MKLDLDRITIKNFASITNKIVFDITKMDHGLHFIRGRNRVQKRLGSNGVGKSTLFGATCWALYGRTPEGLRNPDIEPWYSDSKRSLVVLRVRLDGSPHKILRSTHPNLLTFDGKDVSQEFIDKRLSMNFMTFTNSVLAGQGRPLFLDLSPSDKLSLFSEVLDLERWKVRSKQASEQVAELDEEIRVLDELVKIRKAGVEASSLTIADLKTKSDGFDAEVSRKIEQRSAELKKAQKRLDDLRPRVEDAQLKLEQAMELPSIQEQLEKVTGKLRVIENNKIGFEVKIGHAIRERNDKQLELAELRNAKVCPTCKQSVLKSHTNKHRIELKRQIAQLSKIISMGVPPRTLELIEKYHKRSDHLSAQWSKRQKILDQAHSVVSISAPDLASAQQSVYTLTAELEELRSGSENPYFKEYNDTKKILRVRRDELEENQKESRTKRRQHARTKFWIKGFKDIRLMIVHETLQELELTTNAILEEFGLVGWKILYDVEKETKSGTIKRGLSVSILSPYNDKPVKWDSWSGGEAQRLRLLGTFALSDVLLNRAGIEPSFEIFDEQSKFLSAEGVSDLVDVLADRAARTKKTIFLVDHTTIESSRFASTITVNRTKEGTSLDKN